MLGMTSQVSTLSIHSRGSIGSLYTTHSIVSFKLKQKNQKIESGELEL